MFGKKRVAVVVPVYNEEKFIEKVITTMPGWVDNIIIVDDGSNDRTNEIVKRYVEKNEKLLLIEHEKNIGVGGARITGYKKALELNVDVIATMDGDAQMHPDDLKSVIAPILNNEADYVKGNRLFHKNIQEVMPQLRYFGNSILTLLTKIASGYWYIMDPQCGYTAISKNMLDRIPFGGINKKYAFENDMMIALNIYNARVKNVDVRPVYAGEKSYIKLRSFMPKTSIFLLNRFFWRLKEKYILRNFHPLVLFYIFGIISTIAGFFLGLEIIFIKIITGETAASISILVALLVLFGIQSIFFAMHFDMDFNKNLNKH